MNWKIRTMYPHHQILPGHRAHRSILGVAFENRSVAICAQTGYQWMCALKIEGPAPAAAGAPPAAAERDYGPKGGDVRRWPR